MPRVDSREVVLDGLSTLLTLRFQDWAIEANPLVMGVHYQVGTNRV
jgi:hypothetical protein